MFPSLGAILGDGFRATFLKTTEAEYASEFFSGMATGWECIFFSYS